MNGADREIVERLQQRARDARLVAEAIELHTEGKTGYDIQLDDDAADLIESQDQQLGNLLAVIHGDGGHHTDDVGEQQSLQDAEARWGERAIEIERLTTERDNYEGILRAVCKAYKHDTTGYFTPEAEESA